MGFCARFSDVIWREKQRWRLEMSTVFSSFLKLSSPEIAVCFTWKHLRISSENLWKKIIIFQEFGGIKSNFPILWMLLYSWNKRRLLVAGSMLNLVRALNLTVRLTSTGLALKVRLQFRTCSHLFCFSFFFAWKWIKTAFFRKALTSNQKKAVS